MNALESTLLQLLRGPIPRDALHLDNERAMEQVLVSARDAGLCGLLLESLKRSEFAAPRGFLARLADESKRVAGVNRLAVSRLGRIAAAFADRGIDLLVLKGAALLATAYDDLGHRPMCDIDLLIRPGDVRRADRLLEELGFRRGANHVRRDFFPKYYYEAEYLSRGPHPLRLDVHVRPWRPLRYSRIVPEDALWDTPRTVTIDDATFQAPHDVNMLIHLLGHFAFHGAGRPLWTVDIYRFITRRRADLDWDEFTTRLRRWQLLHAARLAIHRTEERFGRLIPRPVRDALNAAPGSWRDKLVLWQAPRDTRSPMLQVLVNAVCTDGLTFRLGYLRAVLVPDRTHLAETYSRRHPGWVLCAHLRRALRCLAGRPTANAPGAPPLGG
ncbi:MAG: nucleotidyltransferase family protein [Planctomycetes bacterium]|nr:nucleotidyltransferase family protein [Planctomycetota bacterium]